MFQCTCGETEDHIIARRRTADGKLLLAWSCGCVTRGHVGSMIIGRPRFLPRDLYASEDYMRALWLFLDEVALYDYAEVKDLMVAAKGAMRQTSVQPLEYLRRKMAGWNLRTIKGGRVVTWVRKESKA